MVITSAYHFWCGADSSSVCTSHAVIRTTLKRSAVTGMFVIYIDIGGETKCM